MHDNPARYSWYQVWAGAAAVMAIYVAQGKNGKAFMGGMRVGSLSSSRRTNVEYSGRDGDEGHHTEARSTPILGR